MPIDVTERAASLRVISYYQPDPRNTTGRMTPKELYERSAGQHVHNWKTLYGVILHGTVGRDTLTYWLTGGSMAGPNAPYSMAHFLALRDRNTLAKMCPTNKSCNHCGDSDWHDPAVSQPLNSYFLGIECEDLQNWNKGTNAQRITDDQVIKCALVWAYESALDHQTKGAASKAEDRYVLHHSQIALPWGRRSDPDAGLFNDDLFWHVVTKIRRAENWPNFWPARWVGSSPDI
jgi:hypothetical protein